MSHLWRSLGTALVLVAAAAQAQVTRPSLVPSPLEFDPHPALRRAEGPLRQAWLEVLRDRAGVIVPSPKEVDAAFKQTRRQDCRESNECLAQLASKAGTLYAAYAYLEYTVQRQLVLVGRVVRDDGKLMSTARVEVPRGPEALPKVFRGLLLKLVEELGLKDLPTFKEAPRVEAPPPEKAAEPEVAAPIAGPLLVSAPPMPAAQPPGVHPLRLASYIALGVGLAAAAGGAALFATAPAVTTVDGNVLASQRAGARGAYAQQTAAVVLLGVGGAAAVAGALGWMMTPESAVPHVALVPLAGGAYLSLEGRLP
jgi:hypothetical protein